MPSNECDDVSTHGKCISILCRCAQPNRKDLSRKHYRRWEGAGQLSQNTKLGNKEQLKDNNLIPLLRVTIKWWLMSSRQYKSLAFSYLSFIYRASIRSSRSLLMAAEVPPILNGNEGQLSKYRALSL